MRATAASDRYSLAVVAYELLTGGRPFEGASFAEQALQQVESQPEPPSMRAPELSREVDAVLLKGLAKDPAERWESAGAFADGARRGIARGQADPTATRTDRPGAELASRAHHRHSPARAPAASRPDRRGGPGGLADRGRGAGVDRRGRGVRGRRLRQPCRAVRGEAKRRRRPRRTPRRRQTAAAERRRLRRRSRRPRRHPRRRPRAHRPPRSTTRATRS